jgi:hypothetical protein
MTVDSSTVAQVVAGLVGIVTLVASIDFGIAFLMRAPRIALGDTRD